LTNLTFEEVVSYLSRTKVFVHPTIKEHFGIIVPEAMASGCPVVVHKKGGGPWTDTVKEGEYGMGFSDLNELRSAVERLMNRDVWEKYHDISLERAKKFGKEPIRRKLLRVVGS